MNKQDIRVNFKNEDFIVNACNVFKINTENEIINKIDLFKKRFSRTLENKLLNLAMYLNIYEFDIEVKFCGFSFFNLYKRDDMLIYFNIILTNNNVIIGELENFNKFTLHKYNILDIGENKSGFIPSKGDLIDPEQDFLKRIQEMKPEDFVFSYMTMKKISDLDFINHSTKNEMITPIEQHNIFLCDFIKVIIRLTNNNIYDFNIIDHVKFKYIISNGEQFDIDFVLIDDSDVSHTGNTTFSNINYKNEDEFKMIILDIFCQVGILHPEILKHSYDKDYKDIFEISRLLDY